MKGYSNKAICRLVDQYYDDVNDDKVKLPDEDDVREMAESVINRFNVRFYQDEDYDGTKYTSVDNLPDEKEFNRSVFNSFWLEEFLEINDIPYGEDPENERDVDSLDYMMELSEGETEINEDQIKSDLYDIYNENTLITDDYIMNLYYEDYYKSMEAAKEDYYEHQRDFDFD